MVQRIVQGVQNLLHGIPDGKELSPVGGRNVQVHVALGHLGQLFINILDVRFQLPLGLVDGLHQHPDLGGVGGKGEVGGEVALGDLPHLIPHLDHRLEDAPLGEQHDQHLHHPRHHNRQQVDQIDDRHLHGQLIDPGLGPGIQLCQELLLQRVDLGDGLGVLIAVDIADGLRHPARLDILHSVLLQGDQLVGEGGHRLDHGLLPGGDANLLEGRHALVPVFQHVDLVPVVVVVDLIAGGGVGPDLVGEVGGAVHEPVGVVCKVKAVLVGRVEPAADAAADEQERGYHQKGNQGDDIEQGDQLGLIHRFLHGKILL